ncbi:Crp/Fnr family transcriptional regulator [Virgibacillus sp. W0181]|uniref:Crp/Fnr family transcriptional regulator n=1 Tax=Virgibacillus sp. W0181 TaxID=3391581 RepID=UPI003F44BE56
MSTKQDHSCAHDTHRGCVSIVPIFNHLESEQMDEIMNEVQHVSLKKREVLYHAGDESDALYIIHRGKIKIYRLTEEGKEQVIRVLQPGDFTGELALFQHSLHEAFAEAMDDTEICMIQRKDLQGLLSKYPTISLKILTEFANRLDTAEKQSTRFAAEKTETRIALFLAECLERINTDSGEIELPMSKKDLASYLGTTPETLSRRLSQFEAEGYIKQKGQRKIIINDLEGLLLV